MAYVPEEHKKYNMLPECERLGGEAFEYIPETVYYVSEIIGKDYSIFPYNYESYESYFSELDRIISDFSDNAETVELIEKLRKEITDLNQKEEWSILKYVGPPGDNGFGLTPGKNYYWPTSKSNPVYRGVIDNEEFTAYIYPTDADFWEILEDPTGMAFNTIYGNGRKVLKTDYDRMLAEEGYLHFPDE